MQAPRITSQDLRKFGFVVGGVFLAIGAFLLWRSDLASLAGRICGGLGAGLVLLGLAAPAALRPVHRGWMFLAHILGWINTRILLGLVFYVGFTLAHVFLFLFRKDPLARRPDKKQPTYWHDVSGTRIEPASLEHPF